jgi:hypothetical protein
MTTEELIIFLQNHLERNPGYKNLPIHDVHTNAEITGISFGREGIALTTEFVQFEVQPDSKWEYFKEIFDQAKIEVLNHYQIPNEYWSGIRMCAENPWWLVQTNIGMIKIGWRKRVIEIDWSTTLLRSIVTEDDVTKESTMVHAWTKEKAISYLTNLSQNIPQKQDMNKFILKSFKTMCDEHNKTVESYLKALEEYIK